MTKRKTPRKPAALHERLTEPVLTDIQVGLPGLSAKLNARQAAPAMAAGAWVAITALVLLMFGLNPIFAGFARADAMEGMVKQSAFEKAITEQNTALTKHQDLLATQTQAIQSLGLTIEQNRKEIMARIVQSNITGLWMRYCEAMRGGRAGEADAYRNQIPGLQSEYRAFAGADFPLVSC